MIFSEMELQRIALMRAIAEEMAQAEPLAVLKGGTSLLLVYGLDRFSEDMDFDLPAGCARDLSSDILRASSKQGYEAKVSVKKDTETTKRYMLHYGAFRDNNAESCQDYPLKIEFSMRNRKIPEQETLLVQGIRVYALPRLVELKVAAFVHRERARDTYDVVFLVEKYPEAFSERAWRDVKGHVETRGLTALCDSFDEEKADDPLLEKFEGTALLLKLQEAMQRRFVRPGYEKGSAGPELEP